MFSRFAICPVCLVCFLATNLIRAEVADPALDTTAQSGSSAARSESSAPVTVKWTGFAAQGLAYGRGRPSYNGAHALDSLSLTGKQSEDANIFLETLDAAADAKPASDRIQEGEGGLTCKYKRNGFTASLNAGLDYTTALYEKRSRSAKVKSKATLYELFGGELKQKIILDADSNWEWTSSTGYDDEGGQYRTWNFSSGLADDLGDFDVSAEVDGFRESATQDAAPCNSKSGKGCSTQSETSIIKGIGLAAGADWNPDAHLLAVQVKLDWQSSQSVERILTLGAGYTYSPWNWLDIGAGFTHEAYLNVKKNPAYWQASSVLDCHF